MAKGETKQFSAAVKGTGDYPKDVTWEVSSSVSSISSTGLLTVSPSETAPSLTVKATAKGTDKSGAAAVTVIQQSQNPFAGTSWVGTWSTGATVYLDFVDGSNFNLDIVYADSNHPYSGAYTYQGNRANLDGGEYGITGTADLDAGGTALTANCGYFGIEPVIFSKNTGGHQPQIPSSLTVTPAEIELHTGGGYIFTASQEAAWTVEGQRASNTEIVPSGSEGWLRIGSDETASTLTVRAASGVNPNLSGTAAVRVVPTNMESQTGIPYHAAPLTESRWHGDHFAIGANFFYFYADAGSSYDIYWDDRNIPGTSMTGDIKVTAQWYNGNNLQGIPGFDLIEGDPLKGYRGKTITAGNSDYIRIRVDIDDVSNGGHFRIRYDKR
jgi:hypothetical protein